MPDSGFPESDSEFTATQTGCLGTSNRYLDTYDYGVRPRGSIAAARPLDSSLHFRGIPTEHITKRSHGFYNCPSQGMEPIDSSQ